MNIISLSNNVRSGYYDIHPDVEAPFLPNDYVFDENITVAENRKRIEEENAKIEIKRRELYLKECELRDKFMSDIAKFVIDNFGMTGEQASGVVDWVCVEASESSIECRFITFIKAVGLLSCIHNKEVPGIDRIPY